MTHQRHTLPLMAAVMTLALAATAVADPPDDSGWEEIGRYTPGTCRELALDGTVAYLGHGARLEAIDLSDPTQPHLLAQLDLPSGVIDLVVKDGYVYATTRNAGLAIVDARRPGKLKLAGWVPSNNPRWDWWVRVDVAGNTAYCTGMDFTVLDISDPARPRVVKRMEGWVSWDVAVAGDRLYVAGQGGIRVFDITNPWEPAPLAEFDLDRVLSEPTRIQAHDGRVYAMGRMFAVGWDLSGPVVPDNCSLYDICSPQVMAFHGDAIYVAGAPLQRCAAIPGYSDWVDSGPGQNTDVEIAGDLMVAVQAEIGLTTYSLSGTEPQRLATYAAGARIEDIAIADGRAWLACGNAGLRILDVANPRHPRLLGGLSTGFEQPEQASLDAIGVRVHREHALLFGEYGGLRVIDGSDPTAPHLVFSARTMPDGRYISPVEAVAVADGWIVTCGLQGAQTWTYAVLGLRLDDAGSVTMTELAWPTEIPTWNLRTDGRHCYTYRSDQGLVVFDATAGGFVRRLGALQTGWSFVDDMVIDGGFAYVAHDMADNRSIEVVDVTDPTAPRWRGTTGPLYVLLTLPAIHLGASDGMVFVMNDYGYVGLIDATRPDTPVVATTTFVPGAPWALAVVNGTAFAGSSTNGLLVLRVRRAAAAPLAPAQVAGLAVAPNPCNPRAMITFTMAEAGPVTVRVFDARGRLVRQLHDGWLDSGTHDVPWSGDDDNGRPVAAGVYLVRATTNGHADVARVTVVK